MPCKAFVIFGVLLIPGIGCAERKPQAAPTAQGRKYDLFEKPSIDGVRSLTPEEAKAILVARTVYELKYGTVDDGKTEYWTERRFDPEQTGRGWSVGVLRVYHRTVSGRDEEHMEVGVPTVNLDQDYRFVSISFGA